MPKRGNQPIQGELLQGTLDLLILKTLALGPAHGHTIAHAIEHDPKRSCRSSTGRCIPRSTGSKTAAGSRRSGDVGEQPQSAVHRLTPAGRKQLTEQTNRWDTIVNAINRILKPA